LPFSRRKFLWASGTILECHSVRGFSPLLMFINRVKTKYFRFHLIKGIEQCNY
jgi:hypothetical protein